MSYCILDSKFCVYVRNAGTRLRGRDVQLAGVATHYVDADKVV